MLLMKSEGIRVMFYTPKLSLLGWFIRCIIGCKFSHVDIELEGVGYGISLMDGAKLYPHGFPKEPCEILEIPTPDEQDLEFPFMVLDQRISFWDSIKHHVLRWWSWEYHWVTPVTNCVTMVNIILNHNLNTNWFNGYTPDDLYKQTKRYIAHRQQRPSGIPSEENQGDSLLVR